MASSLVCDFYAPTMRRNISIAAGIAVILFHKNHPLSGKLPLCLQLHFICFTV